jgi:Heterokaryon incompatibility protein (HET)
MPPYQYIQLADPKVDIRVLKLLPGKFDDDIEVEIYHTPLICASTHSSPRWSLSKLQETLPKNWEALPTMEGEILFVNKSLKLTSWKHPNADIEPEMYNIHQNVQELEANFEALSYTWGTLKSSRPLHVINPKEQIKWWAIEIQHNLDVALRYLRRSNQSRNLWVDAIAIDQNNILEREFQIRRMGDIYKSAFRVVAWLGPESNNSEQAMSTLDNIGAQIVVWNNGVRIPRPGATHQDWFRPTTELPYSEDTWKVVKELLERPWFDRLWVIQEIQLAKISSVLQCGYSTVSWSHFRSAIISLYSNVQHSLQAAGLPLIKIYRFVWPLQSADFHELLSTTAAQLCSNPRDKVYGLLGLTSPSVLASITPQYSKSVAFVYQDAFFAMVKETQRLDVLESCTRAHHNPYDLPSWVPDWSLSVDGRPRGVRQAQLASGMSCAQVLMNESGILTVSGIVVATVSKVKGTSPNNTSEALAVIKTWAPDDIQQGTYATGEPVVDAFASVLTANNVKENVPNGHLRLSTFKEALLRHLSSKDIEISNRSSDLSRHRLERLVKRTFIVTEDGYFGLGPADAESGMILYQTRVIVTDEGTARYTGDLICTILGCSSQIVLRPLSAGRFEVVGSCLLHGFSSAEGILGPLPPSWKLQFQYQDLGSLVPYFYNQETEQVTEEDPRLEPLPSEWERLRTESKVGSLSFSHLFRSTSSGEIMNSDPRMLPDNLKLRGVKLQSFELV